METKNRATLSYAGSNLTTGVTPCHAHRGAELIYVASGKCRLEGEGIRTLEGAAGTLFIVPPGTSHRRRNLGACRTFHVVFEVEPGDFELEFRAVDTHADRLISRWFHDLAALDGEGDGELGEALLAALLLRVARREAIDDRWRQFHPGLKRALAHIGEHCDQPLPVDELARIAGVSQSHLNALFRQATGKGAKHYILGCRMQLARRLLRDPNNNISEVAFRCGFSDAHYFSRSFRDFHGRSPSDYRKDPGSRGDKPESRSGPAEGGVGSRL